MAHYGVPRSDAFYFYKENECRKNAVPMRNNMESKKSEWEKP